MTNSTRQTMEETVIAVLRDTVQDWDLELDTGITGSTKLIEELSFESIDVVQFAVALEQALGSKGLPFEKLFIQEGNYVDDVTVSEVVEFLNAEMRVAA
jgi:acyl carrier protein